MRIIKERTLWQYCGKSRFAPAKAYLQGWVSEVRQADWDNPAMLKSSFQSASLIDSERVVFNVKGNRFRLVVDINYRHRIVFIIWFGTHEENNKINVEELTYGD